LTEMPMSTVMVEIPVDEETAPALADLHRRDRFGRLPATTLWASCCDGTCIRLG
jgi:hypothetical protein